MLKYVNELPILGSAYGHHAREGERAAEGIFSTKEQKGEGDIL